MMEFLKKLKGLGLIVTLAALSACGVGDPATDVLNVQNLSQGSDDDLSNPSCAKSDLGSIVPVQVKSFAGLTQAVLFAAEGDLIEVLEGEDDSSRDGSKGDSAVSFDEGSLDRAVQLCSKESLSSFGAVIFRVGKTK